MKGILLSVVLIAGLGGYTVSRNQTDMDTSAYSDMETLRTWPDLDNWRMKYAPKYDDGSGAEGIADFVERKLSEDWASLKELVALSKKSPGLFEFAVSHLGEITLCNSAKIIVTNALVHCPSGQEKYCTKIRDPLIASDLSECLPIPLLKEHGIPYKKQGRPE
jgi:hypothetical protein